MPFEGKGTLMNQTSKLLYNLDKNLIITFIKKCQSLYLAFIVELFLFMKSAAHIVNTNHCITNFSIRGQTL